MESPLLQVGLVVLIAYVFRLWLSDLRAAKNEKPNSGTLPGAKPCTGSILLLGIFGALILVAMETAGETVMGISSEQTTMTVLFALVTIASAFGEELIFRGYLVIQNKGKAVLWMSIIGFSVLFAFLHPFLWKWENGALMIQFSAKAWFSTAIVLLNSLWFYFLRFSRYNKGRSLWPCIAAHAISNAAVFFVKLAQGYVSGLY